MTLEWSVIHLVLEISRPLLHFPHCAINTGPAKNSIAIQSNSLRSLSEWVSQLHSADVSISNSYCLTQKQYDTQRIIIYRRYDDTYDIVHSSWTINRSYLVFVAQNRPKTKPSPWNSKVPWRKNYRLQKNVPIWVQIQIPRAKYHTFLPSGLTRRAYNDSILGIFRCAYCT